MSFLNTMKFIINHPLNRGHRFRSIMRFARWQARSRLVPGAVVYEWVNGSKFLVKAGETGLTGNIYAGLHELPDMAFLLHVLRSDDLFVDVGANAGAYTLLACSAIGAEGIAFEPLPDAYKRLVENMRLNHLDKRVKCINKGVGAEHGSMAFTRDSDTTNHALAAGEKCDTAVTVDITSLDAALHGNAPALVKIDVEGFETPVLEGACKTLQNHTLRSVIMELNGSCRRYGFDESRIIELMADHGFATYTYNPFERMLIDLNGKSLGSGNTLFIRDKSFVEQRLRSAPNVSIHGSQL